MKRTCFIFSSQLKTQHESYPYHSNDLYFSLSTLSGKSRHWESVRNSTGYLRFTTTRTLFHIFKYILGSGGIKPLDNYVLSLREAQ